MAIRELLVVVSLACVSSHIVNDGWIAFRRFDQPSGHVHYAVTDGHWSLDALVTSEGFLKSCDVTSDPDSVLEASDLIWRKAGKDTARKLFESCKRFANVKRGADKDNGSQMKVTTTLPFAPEETGDPAGAKGSFAIFPGTKWCGLDNKASSYDDLGEHRATDSCCRTHDHCPYFIDHFETKYHYRNPYPWTLSYCDCDMGLYNCLQKVNTTAANEVGEMFFGLLNVKCFDFENGSYCSDEHLAGLWCEKEAYGEKAVTRDFPHKWGDGTTGSNTAKAGLVG
ncbi:group 3 secretory phospholipase A2-like [Argopecten irradians]|uniref:group 3 secretory phospholipase A2-like n=1 Tax=Argopecten irradians TaxID=31199 RepID=UPI003717373C